MSSIYKNTFNTRDEQGKWVDYKRQSVQDIPEFSGWKFIKQLIREAMRTRYYMKEHPFLDAAWREERRDYLRQFDMNLIIAAFLTGCRISEILMSHVENFIIEDEYIRVTGLPLLKRMKKTQTITDILYEPPQGPNAEKYHYSKNLDAFIRIKWETEPEIAVRQDFPIPRWEPFVNLLIHWIKQAPEGPGGYKWLFPTSKEPTREESSGIQLWIQQEFGLEARAWVSPERVYQKIRAIGERVNAKQVLGHNLYDHWFRSQRASQLGTEYEFREPHLNRFFGWAGGWTTSRQSMAARYARTGFSDLWDRMRLNRNVVERQKEVLFK
jgi:integrase